MSNQEIRVNLFDLLFPLAKAVDMMSPNLGRHHLQVAYLAFRICERLEVPADELRDTVVAALLHDIGAFSLEERVDLLKFEEREPHKHSVAGYLLLRDFPPFERAATLIKHHHVDWRNGKGAEQGGEEVPRASHILRLADRAAVLLPQERKAIEQAPSICQAVAKRAGSVFVPEFVDALRRLEKRDYVWLEATSDQAERVLRRSLASHEHSLDLDGLRAFSRLMCRIIDFKSEFTATHTSGLVAAATELARLCGFSEDECRMMEVAAYLHDLGKLAIPSEILEKPDRLDDKEWSVMRSHVYHTFEILDPIEGLGVITSWSALHQERMDGSGYPFGYTADDLPMGARVVAVADVFTGITEERPYRKGMAEDEAQGVLQEMAEGDELDGKVVEVLLDHFHELNVMRANAQATAIDEYRTFRAALA